MLFLLILLHWLDPVIPQQCVHFSSSKLSTDAGDLKGHGGYVYFNASYAVIYIEDLKQPPAVYQIHQDQNDYDSSDHRYTVTLSHYKPGTDRLYDRPNVSVSLDFLPHQNFGSIDFESGIKGHAMISFDHGTIVKTDYAKMEAIIQSAIAKHQVH